MSFIEDLIDLKQLREGIFSLEKDPVNVNSIIKAVCDTFKPQAKAKKITMSYQLGKDTCSDSKAIPFLYGDKRRIKQILMNLIKNALKFTKQGTIVIKAEYIELVNSPELKVQITDTGLGIAEGDMNKLFTRFGKLQRTASINSEGIGLGLTIVQQIVESAGGAITVTSPGVGYGSTFTFTLPMNVVKQDEQESSDSFLLQKFNNSNQESQDHDDELIDLRENADQLSFYESGDKSVQALGIEEEFGLLMKENT